MYYFHNRGIAVLSEVKTIAIIALNDFFMFQMSSIGLGTFLLWGTMYYIEFYNIKAKKSVLNGLISTLCINHK